MYKGDAQSMKKPRTQKKYDALALNFTTKLGGKLIDNKLDHSIDATGTTVLEEFSVGKKLQGTGRQQNYYLYMPLPCWPAGSHHVQEEALLVQPLSH